MMADTGFPPDELLTTMPASAMRALTAESGCLPETRIVTFSRKVFVPVTQLCRDVCHYCTFAKTPRALGKAFLELDDILAIAEKGARAGCKEALFTLGDQPEARYAQARDALRKLRHASTIDYVAFLAEQVLREIGLIPHINAGVLVQAQYEKLRDVSASYGLMLENTSDRLCLPGMPHHGSPDKQPAVRLESIAAAGRARLAMTTGLLIGIGESRLEVLQSLRAIKALHDEHGHIQEILIQNFQPKPDTRMAKSPPAMLEELLWAISATRIVFGPDMVVQVPPNLNAGRLPLLLEHGVTDWGGISPVTRDEVNPEAAWPAIASLERETSATGRILVERLCLQPPYSKAPEQWSGHQVARTVLAQSDADGWARTDAWMAGSSTVALPAMPTPLGDSPIVWRPERRQLADTLARAEQGGRLGEADICLLFAARGEDCLAVTSAADAMRRQLVGDTATFVVNMNINYTNICTHRCTFCAYSKGQRRPDLSPGAYRLDVAEIVSRVGLAAANGATEICLQGGIHPDYTGDTYLQICSGIRSAFRDIHIHAFSPLEVSVGARTIGLSIAEYLSALRDAGLNSLPGTAAEILDDRIRPRLCPDKLTSEEWLSVVRTAHKIGLPTTSTIMFGHLDRPGHWARHLLALRDLQDETGGLTEFVPLPFVHFEAPLFRRGQARRGPTFREALLMHAVSRLVFGSLLPNIQASWVKLGLDGAAQCLAAGANDLGGTLMSESISRAAGATHGQGVTIDQMRDTITAAGRIPRQRTTLYGAPSARPGAAEADLALAV
jgi:FO synthase